MFWSGETLEARLDELIFDKDGQSSGNKDKIDCAAYTLTIGPEIYITPSEPSKDPRGHQVITLSGKGDKGDFEIPTGQFVFLLTEEFVHVPKDAIGFISLKTKNLKFKGLINVSGFHVDPGYKGRIIFSAFNAGPQKISLQRGDEFATIWFAGLDRKTDRLYKKKALKDIPSEIYGGINGEVFSPMVIKSRLEAVERDAKEVLEKVKLWFCLTVIAGLVATLINFNFGAISKYFLPSKAGKYTVEGTSNPIRIELNSSAENIDNKTLDRNQVQEPPFNKPADAQAIPESPIPTTVPLPNTSNSPLPSKQ